MNVYEQPVLKICLLCKSGNSHIPLPVPDLQIFYVVSKLTFVKDAQGNKYISDRSLGELEEQLDPSLFFRVNRKMILNVNAIAEYRIIEYGKIAIILKDKSFGEVVIVSQVTAPHFKKWINDL